MTCKPLSMIMLALASMPVGRARATGPAKPGRDYLRATLLLLGIVLLAIDVGVLLYALYFQPDAALQAPTPPCLHIPERFIAEHPDCANHLLHAANITNVHIEPGPAAAPRD